MGIETSQQEQERASKWLDDHHAELVQNLRVVLPIKVDPVSEVSSANSISYDDAAGLIEDE